MSSEFEGWAALVAELDEWRRAGLTAKFWIRDDDAIALTPQLERLTGLARAVPTEIALAVIPSRLTAPLADYLNSGEAPFYPMCHGWRHINYHAPLQPSEFGPDRPMRLLIEDAERAFKAFSDRFAKVSAVFVPPYSRIAPALASELPKLGFRGLSVGPPATERRFARIAAQLGSVAALCPASPPRARHYDVHIDPFDWGKGTARSIGSLAREAVGYLRLRRYGVVSADRPIGILLHHLAFDAATWSLCDALLFTLASHPAAAWPSVSEVLQESLDGTRETMRRLEVAPRERPAASPVGQAAFWSPRRDVARPAS